MFCPHWQLSLLLLFLSFNCYSFFLSLTFSSVRTKALLLLCGAVVYGYRLWISRLYKAYPVLIHLRLDWPPIVREDFIYVSYTSRDFSVYVSGFRQYENSKTPINNHLFLFVPIYVFIAFPVTRGVIFHPQYHHGKYITEKNIWLLSNSGFRVSVFQQESVLTDLHFILSHHEKYSCGTPALIWRN